MVKRFKDWWDRLDGKTRSRYVVWGMGAFAVIVLSLVYLQRTSTREEEASTKTKKEFSVKPDGMAEGKWLATGEERLNNIEKALRDRDGRIQALQKELDAMRNGGNTGRVSTDGGGDIQSQINQMIKSGPITGTLGDLSPEPTLSSQAPSVPQVTPTKTEPSKDDLDSSVKPLLPQQVNVPGKPKPPIPDALKASGSRKSDSASGSGSAGGSAGIKVYSAAGKKADEEPLAEKKEAKESKSASFYVPSGTLTKAMILGGLDAPTMGKAKNSPHPILLRLQDYSFLPNEVRQDWEGCVLLGEGYGDLSAERAYVRVLNMSCVDRQHKTVFDSAVAGWLLDSDGKNGLRGRVVTKQGALLARSLMAAFVQGVANGFSEASSGLTTVTTGTGVIQTQDTMKDFKDGFKSGAYDGMSEAANDLADFYMDMANEVTPVIEIGAEREVTVIFHKGFQVNFDKDLVTNNNESL